MGLSFNQVSLMNIDFKDLKATRQSQFFVMNIVLIDKSTERAPPMLYQLREQAISFKDNLLELKQELTSSLLQSAFLQIGEVIILNKKDKQILLLNNDTIMYTHLIVASSTKHPSGHVPEITEFGIGLQTLVAALRLRLPAFSAFSDNNRSPSESRNSSPIISLPSKVEQTATAKKITPPSVAKDRASFLDLTRASKLLFEVQI